MLYNERKVNIREACTWIKINDNSKTEGMSFKEYLSIKDLLEVINKLFCTNHMCYGEKEKKVREYLLFTAKYNSTKSNTTSLAAFNGLFYFFIFFIRNGFIKYDVLFELFNKMFEVEVNIDEIASE